MNYEDNIIKQIISALNESTATLNPEITAGLALGRNKALAAFNRRSSAESSQSVFARLWKQYMPQHRAAMSAALVCSAVFVAFLVTQQFSEQDMAGQGDAFLLASELPPEAYLDKGFDVWLERTSKQ